jgi:hypothetical protein
MQLRQLEELPRRIRDRRPAVRFFLRHPRRHDTAAIGFLVVRDVFRAFGRRFVVLRDSGYCDRADSCQSREGFATVEFGHVSCSLACLILVRLVAMSSWMLFYAWFS